MHPTWLCLPWPCCACASPERYLQLDKSYSDAQRLEALKRLRGYPTEYVLQLFVAQPRYAATPVSLVIVVGTDVAESAVRAWTAKITDGHGRFTDDCGPELAGVCVATVCSILRRLSMETP
jgi:hypothetical protein